LLHSLSAQELLEWEVFFALEGGWPAEWADWRAGTITAMIANLGAGLGGSRKTWQPQDFYRPHEPPGGVGAAVTPESPQPTEEDLTIMNRLVANLQRRNGPAHPE
jgi:hypothetical protein